MGEHLTPVAVAECLLGTPATLSGIVGLDRSAAFGWRNPSKFRDAGDFPSTRIQRALLAHSEAHGLGLTADHLIRGAARAEVEAILAAREIGSAPQQVAAE
jgi:hypothetical protein